MKFKYISLVFVYLLAMFLGSQYLPFCLLIFIFALKDELVSCISKINILNSLKWGIAGSGIALAFQYIHSLIMQSQSINTESLIQKSIDNPLTILLIILMAPMLEELVFRHILFIKFKKKIGSIAAAAISAFLFSFIHFDFNNLIIYIVMGLTFSWIYFKSKSIVAPIMSHVMMNTIILFLNWW